MIGDFLEVGDSYACIVKTRFCRESFQFSDLQVHWCYRVDLLLFGFRNPKKVRYILNILSVNSATNLDGKLSRFIRHKLIFICGVGWETFQLWCVDMHMLAAGGVTIFVLEWRESTIHLPLKNGKKITLVLNESFFGQKMKKYYFFHKPPPEYEHLFQNNCQKPMYKMSTQVFYKISLSLHFLIKHYLF